MEKISYKVLDRVNLKARILRFNVFCIEQHIAFKDEFVNDDKEFKHLYMYINNIFIGYCRFKIEDDYIHIGRIIIKRRYRSKGYGIELLRIVDEIALSLSIYNLYLNAQERAMGFYEKCGYSKVGNVFMDANIRHYKMIKTLDKKIYNKEVI